MSQRVAVVTGAASGIGLAVAEALAGASYQGGHGRRQCGSGKA